MATQVVLKKASLGTSSLLAGAALTGIALSYAYSWSRDDGSSNSKRLAKQALLNDPEGYKHAKLISSKNVGAGAKVLRFRLENSATLGQLKPFSHVTLRGITTDVPPEYPFGLRVERSYTPISSGKHDFEVLVKSYPVDTKVKEKNPKKAATSRYLLSLERGDHVEVKGPVATTDDEVLREAVMTRKFIGFICGGSGITPAVQLLSRLGSADSSRKFSILWSNRSADDMFFKKELEYIIKGLKNVNLRYTLTRTAPSGWQHDTGRVSKEMLRARMPPPSPETLIVVCGPDSFIEAVAGGRRASNGKWTGPLGGFLGDLQYTSEHVIRL